MLKKYGIFGKVIVDYKMEIKGVTKNLKINKNLKMIIVKIYLGMSLELLRAVWDQLSVR